ncbi:MAG: HAMP domain-containing sensor histidine kinase [Melioribacteraceae bacterium]|nr:MAG: HAMP domain-containing sensor histidine kinase [Melioribacteraceae bacterium]
MVGLAALAYFPSVILAVEASLWDVAIIDTVAYAIVIFLYMKKPMNTHIKSTILVSVLYILAIMLLFVLGSSGAGYLWLFFLPIVASVFMKQIYAYSFLVLNVIILILFGILRYTGIYTPISLGEFSLEIWIIIIVNFATLNAFTVFAFLLLINGLTKTIESEREVIKELQTKSDELKIAKRNAEKADSLKSEFLAQMSHEIRTPINTILSFSYLIKEDIKENRLENIDEYFSSIERGSSRVIRTIDLILNLSELQSGTYEPKIEKIDLQKDVINGLYSEFLVKAKKQNLQLILKSDSSKKYFVNADLYTTTQIFANLIDNAIKYTLKGEVKIFLSENDKKVIVDIIDSGIGMSKEFQKNLFEPFSQEESGYTRKFEGTGLGLALVKKYCEVNNVEISVESIKGKGTIFSISFPNPLIE